MRSIPARHGAYLSRRDSNLKQVTILIPTHNRHKYLKRALDFYSPWEVQKVVVDSSDERYEGPIDALTQYIHRPKTGYIDKMAEVLAQIETPFVVLAADDDFISPIAIATAADFMARNDDCACVQGRHIGFFRQSSPFPAVMRFAPVWYALHVFAHDYRIDAPEIKARLLEQAGNYMNNFYSLHRTAVAGEFFSRVCPGLSQDILKRRPEVVEVAFALFTVVRGSHVVLPVFWVARESIADSLGANCETRSAEGGEDEDLCQILSELAKGLETEPDKKEIAADFITAYKRHLDFRVRWESGEIPHMGSIGNAIESSLDSSMFIAMAKAIRRHPFDA